MDILRSMNQIVLLSVCLSAASSDISLKGTVTDGSQPLAGAVVSLLGIPELFDSTDDAGEFLIAVTGTTVPFGFAHEELQQFYVSGAAFTFNSSVDVTNGSVVLFTGNGRKTASVSFNNLPAGTHAVALPNLCPGFYLMQVTINRFAATGKLVTTGGQLFMSGMEGGPKEGGVACLMKKMPSPVDELMVVKTGYVTKTVPIDSYRKEDIVIVLEEEGDVECPDFDLPSKSAFPSNEKLPDPFKFIDGTRLERKADWPCLREQLIGLLSYSLGEKPPKPEKVEAEYSNRELDITCSEAGKTISFSVSINAPSGEGPHPAIITLGRGGFMGGSVIPIPAGIGEIQYDHDGMAEQSGTSSRGKGLFYQLYGSDHSAGAMMAWAWGVSRIIDALEMTEGHDIDPSRLGITGCSRNGKGAMVCGAFDERMTLTLPMEGGSGGISSWRIAKVENSNKSAHPDGCQTASQIVGENVWMSPEFDSYAGGDINGLSTDAHTLAAIIAPRAVYFVEGSQNSWNCNVCCWTAASAARMVYQALGYESNIGIVMTNHNHCSGYSSAESIAWNAFCNRFLLGNESTSTDYFTNDGSFDNLIDFDTWIDWEAPVLP